MSLSGAQAHTLLGAGLCAYLRRRSVQKELELAIKGLQDKYDEAIASIPEEYPAVIKGTMKGIVKAGIKKECKREIKGKREQYANKATTPWHDEEEYEGMLQMLELAVKDMCKEDKVQEKVGRFIFSLVMFVRRCRT